MTSNSSGRQANGLFRDQLEPARIGLEESETSSPGITRRRRGRGWSFHAPNGRALSGKARVRCLGLAVPPAWTDVWICPSELGHIQACGLDAQERRQYIYHETWNAAAATTKFMDLPAFARGLPRLRSRLTRILRDPSDPDELALACVVSLMDAGGLRIGSHRHWARTGAVGAITLRRKHIEFGDGSLELQYLGKGGQERHVQIDDPELTAALHQLAETSGESVFAPSGQPVTPGRTNAFIARLMGARFTAKDFRTWGGSVAAARYLRSTEEPVLKEMAQAAAIWLGNTPAVAQSAYIHPALLDLARSGLPVTKMSGPTRLRVDERACYSVIAGWKSDNHRK
ncbi:DNA topoisomerase IB [Maricaulis sp. CAU 1757]